jgi:hypothetical protein
MKMQRRILLVCGVLSSLVYVAADVLAAILYPAYHSFASRWISELMASGAPTERLVDPLFLLYDLLVMAFGVGVWLSGPRRREHITGGLLFGLGALGLLGPTLFEMNVRGTGDSSKDVAHIALTMVMVLLILGSVGVGAALRGRMFRVYSYATLLIMVVFGILTSLTARGVATGDPTPWTGLTERVNIGAFLLWVGVLAVSLLRAAGATAPRATRVRPSEALVTGR